MKRVAVVAEGSTEYNFVQDVLRCELKNVDVVVRDMRGGGISVPSVLRRILPLLHGKFDCVTTMVDFYKFANPGRNKSAEDIEGELAKNAAQNKRGGGPVFLPYVQKHEFESLLFADRDAVSEYLGLSAAQHKKLNAVKGKPEDINHDAPPSKRLIGIHGEYNKAVDGIEIVRNIGLAKIARECPRFGKWLSRLKKIAKQ